MTTLLVASGGGHLQQLASLVPRFGLEGDTVWATPSSGLADHLLRDEIHVVLPHTPPRDWRAAVHLVGPASDIITEYDVTRVISTGASPAPPFFLAAAPHGLEMHYIESATRSHGPSLSGKLVSTIPAVHLYSQYPSWAHGRWHFAGSIFDPFSKAPASDPDQPIREVVVTLGTETYCFRRALEQLIKVLPRDAHVLWQTGATDTEGLGIRGRESVPGDELRDAIARADLVVSHAGTGSAITCFELGKTPLILPREARYGEHVDEHQSLTADELSRRGLAVAVAVDELAPEHLVQARSGRVLMDDLHRPFELVQPRVSRHLHVTVRPGHRHHNNRDNAGVTLEIHCPDIACMLQRAVAEATVGSASVAEAELRRVASHKAAAPGHRAQALETLIELLSFQGRHAECANLQRERLSLPFDQPARRLTAQMELIVHLVASGGLEEAVWTAAHWVSETEAAGTAATHEGVRLRAALADLLRMQGDLISAELQVGLATWRAERLGDPTARASALWIGALVSAEQGRFAEAAELGRSAADCIWEAGLDVPASLVELIHVIRLLDTTPDEAGTYPDTEVELAAMSALRENGAELATRHAWVGAERGAPRIPAPRDDRHDTASSSAPVGSSSSRSPYGSGALEST